MTRPDAGADAGDGGALVLVATPIGNLGDLSARAVDVLRTADVIAAEDTRRTRALLTHAGVPAAGRVRAVHAHNERDSARAVVDAVAAGQRVAYVTDAGMPGISDPGERLVRACVDAGLPVEVVPGPSAVLAAVVLSGFDTSRFVFEGFLPRRGPARRARLAELAQEPRTAVLFEAPNRVAGTLSELLAACGPLREVAVARELTKLHEEVWRGELSDAVARAATTEPRGEHVIVLASAPEPPAASDAEIEAHVLAALSEGLSSRDAAARVARDLGVPRRRVYDAATRHRRAREQ
jgi:16S rRNA (cytidine1402-2'-O)-methyltransferase